MTFPMRGIGEEPTGLTNPIYAMWCGQSNAIGAAVSAPEVIAGSWSLRRDLSQRRGLANVWHREGPYTIDTASDATTPTRIGSQRTFAATAIAAGRSPVTITCGRESTNFSFWDSGQICRDNFDSVCAEIGDIAALPIAFIWSQGEADASDLTLANAYQARFADWLAHVRTKLPNSYILARLLPNDAGLTYRATINAGVTTVIGGLSNAATLNTDSYGYSWPHWTAFGYNTMGPDEYAAVAAHV